MLGQAGRQSAKGCGPCSGVPRPLPAYSPCHGTLLKFRQRSPCSCALTRARRHARLGTGHRASRRGGALCARPVSAVGAGPTCMFCSASGAMWGWSVRVTSAPASASRMPTRPAKRIKGRLGRGSSRQALRKQAVHVEAGVGAAQSGHAGRRCTGRERTRLRVRARMLQMLCPGQRPGRSMWQAACTASTHTARQHASTRMRWGESPSPAHQARSARAAAQGGHA